MELGNELKREETPDFKKILRLTIQSYQKKFLIGLIIFISISYLHLRHGFSDITMTLIATFLVGIGWSVELIRRLIPTPDPMENVLYE